MKPTVCRRLALALTLTSLAVASFAGPAVAQTSGTETAVDPAATTALDRMGAYLRTLAAFQVVVATSQEEVLDNGIKVQHDGTTNLVARKPDRLRAEVSSDLQERQYLYDGKQFTLWAPRMSYYATVPAPATIGELVDVLNEKYGLEVPLVDLFRWGADGAGGAGITVAVDLGPSTAVGVTCQHYAFRQEGLDWQVWIQKGDYPLPRKLVLTTTDDEARPQFEATYIWNLAPSFNDAAFTFDPPSDAQKIVLAESALQASEKK